MRQRGLKSLLAGLALYGSCAGAAWPQTFTDGVRQLENLLKREALKATEGAVPKRPAPSQAMQRQQSVLIGGMMGLPDVGNEQAGNVLGVMQSCIQDGLGDSVMETIIVQLLDRLNGGDAAALAEDAGYRQGLEGVLTGSDGSTFDLKTIASDDLRTAACNHVANEGSFLL